MDKFDTLHYLADGNPLQQRSYEILTQHSIFETLKKYSPILIGTIPIDIAIENSDLDIACKWEDKTEFIQTIANRFSKYPDFKIKEVFIENLETVVASFFTDGFEIEIFGQNLPVKEQMGYRHMIIENRILKEKDDNFRRSVIELKRNGMKTEPAFAYLLGLNGDPYQALLSYYK
ncbi:DUF4269 domain-containing protein [Flavobacterium pedocola]